MGGKTGRIKLARNVASMQDRFLQGIRMANPPFSHVKIPNRHEGYERHSYGRDETRYESGTHDDVKNVLFYHGTLWK